MRLTSSPSSGRSEVLATLRTRGGGRNGSAFATLGRIVSREYHAQDSEGADAQFETDLVTVLSALQTAGYVTGRDADDGTTVDLTAGVPASDTRILFTPAGRTYSRHPRPRPVVLV